MSLSVPVILVVEVIAILFPTSFVAKYPAGANTILSFIKGFLSLLVPAPGVIAARNAPPATGAAIVPSYILSVVTNPTTLRCLAVIVAVALIVWSNV